MGVALLLGAGTGASDVLTEAVARPRPEDKATIFAAAISEAMNCAAFFVVVLVPISVVLVFVVRRWRRRARLPRAG